MASSRVETRRRTFAVFFVVVIILVAFVIRLFDIQVVSASDHLDNAARLSFNAERTLPGERGSIVDSNGVVLASNATTYDVKLDPFLTKTPLKLKDEDGKQIERAWEDVSKEIADVVGMDVADVRKPVADALASNPEARFAPLKKGVSTETFRKLREINVPYIGFDAHQVRRYPNGAVAGNLIGFVRGDGTALAGLEMSEEQCLAPTDGTERWQPSKDGVQIPGTLERTPAVNGGTLALTINSDLDWYLRQMIAEEVKTQRALSGSVMVVEVKTGKVRAAAEYPSLDPNDYAAAKAEDRGSRLFTTTFEPGSTFKPITAGIVMQETDTTPLSTVKASSNERFPNGARVSDAFVHPSYNYTLAGALIDSSNVAVSKFGTKVSPEKRFDWLKRIGVGSRTSIAFPGEETGILPPASEWDNQSIYATTFGQHYTVTVPRVVSAYQTIANGGEQIPLSLVESCTAADGTVSQVADTKPTRIFDKQVADDVVKMLENVASQGALEKAIEVPGYRLATKTGTAQKPAAGGGYKSGIFYTSIVGIVPADDPQYIVMVSLDEPRRVTSSAATASAFHKAVTQVVKTYRVMPSSEPLSDPLPKFGK